MRSFPIYGAFLVALLAASARGQSAPGPASLMLNEEAADEASAAAIPFGDAGSRYWTVLTGAAFVHDSTDANVYAGMGFFLTDRFEFNFGLGGWWFWQEGEDTGGVNPAIGFRYHFMPHEAFNVYLDAGIGLLFSGDDVPENGESVNFTPRAGVGTLWRLGESGARLDVGVRWHHISTASTSGSDDNPSRDSAMVYAGVVFPF
ncbi:MAG: acyloxyacyl hydrolase [Phycisphaerae bacterium]|nr:acyloxyacyl hydrolase [Phycisphaerae bacterium]